MQPKQNHWKPDEDFEILLNFLSEVQLDRVGRFQYSPVYGVHANALADHVPEEIKQERRDRFMQTRQAISQGNCNTVSARRLMC